MKCSCIACRKAKGGTKAGKALNRFYEPGSRSLYKVVKAWFRLVDDAVRYGIEQQWILGKEPHPEAIDVSSYNPTGIEKDVVDASAEALFHRLNKASPYQRFGIVNNVADWGCLNHKGATMLTGPQVRIYGDVAGKAAELAKFKGVFNLPNKRAIAWSKQHVTPFMQDLVSQTRRGIQHLVTDSLERGLSTKEMAREVLRLPSFSMNPRQARALGKYRGKLTGIQDKIAAALKASGGNMTEAAKTLRIKVPKSWIKQVKAGTFSVDKRVAKEAAKKVRYRAEMIARTEVADAVSAGTLEGYKEAKVKKVRWEAALDACEVCSGYDGNIYTLLESQGQQPAHVSCRCVWVPVGV